MNGQKYLHCVLGFKLSVFQGGMANEGQNPLRLLESSP